MLEYTGLTESSEWWARFNTSTNYIPRADIHSQSQQKPGICKLFKNAKAGLDDSILHYEFKYFLIRIIPLVIH